MLVHASQGALRVSIERSWLSRGVAEWDRGYVHPNPDRTHPRPVAAGLWCWTSDSDATLGCAPLLPSAGNHPSSIPQQPRNSLGLVRHTFPPPRNPKITMLHCKRSWSLRAAGHRRSCWTLLGWLEPAGLKGTRSLPRHGTAGQLSDGFVCSCCRRNA